MPSTDLKKQADAAVESDVNTNNEAVESSTKEESSNTPSTETQPEKKAEEPEAAAEPSESTSTPTNASSVATPSGTAPTSASLYVGELDPSVTEAMLFELFNSIGPVASIRVCRDAVTRRSLGYAYVNFHNMEDGEKALDELNYTLIKGRPCRIMWSQRDPSLRKMGTGNVFIKNLDPAIDNKALHDTFSAFGKILSCKVAVDELGNAKGYGFVHFDSVESANAAIEHVNGMLLNDKKVYVGHHVSRRERQSKVEALKANFTNVYIKNLDTEITEQEFSDLFGQFGEITSLSLVKDQNDKPRGFGFVNYANHECAQKAVDELNDKEYKGKKLYVGRAQKKHEREEELRKRYEQMKLEKMNKYQGVNLFIKNLQDEVDDERLKAEFSAFGTITSAKIMTDEQGKSKGFGFVCYTTPEEANKAVTEMNQRMLAGKPLYVALAQRKEVRRSQLEAQIQARNQFRLQQQVAAAAGIPAVQYGATGPLIYGPGGYPIPAAVNGRGMPMVPGHNGPMPMYPGMPTQFPAGGPAPGYPGMNARGPVPAQGRPMMMPGSVPSAGPAEAEAVPAVPGMPERFTAADLAAVPEESRKQVLGELLYPKVFVREEKLSGKITGMLLEMPNSELLELLEDDSALNERVNEAIGVLQEFVDQEPGFTE
ncbi:Polyadenylate-binding protein, cytoplasmic and nuclear [Schizosaccharomyces pombe]|uniref:Polyadenylate-binding protein, cytoplasmic and nuclear n=1 Tax=Schizosaccharomyces pombe (strain 972 / ATCC 24843) TaxID=284812 RepID=PABP_SCHPO|nr:mRNA export shuttling protein [Schizosaccharomyces pombe]P31209.2 RecName: Full=Polyadenylate-binding protein, cytoplasmic and nuclear; Short=PABP; Short=Poly(A)-binding protein; AltName: Full=Polyadenylate tail-binding protein [Schizosaccharomyces pombe 972h-]CAB08762.1 mRNA export shuttling protein [Schizosaccharomyces pombe]|eukprot:NP_593377.1 mRNA export shuttling protein [Schizosaccharomyces pombe]